VVSGGGAEEKKGDASVAGRRRAIAGLAFSGEGSG
jgi:hypothetical protein